MHALIICEDAQFAELVTVALRQVGLRGVVRRTSPVDSNQLNDVAIILLDVRENGASAEAVEALRRLTPSPILLLAPPATEDTQLVFYRSGATGVVMKPFDLRLLAAQALALTRLVAVAGVATAPHPLIDPERQTIRLPHGVFRLSTLEYRLVAALLSRPGRVFTPEQLVESVWGYSGEGDRGLVKGLVNRVRRKVEPSPQHPHYLITEAGVGYCFTPPDVLITELVQVD